MLVLFGYLLIVIVGVWLIEKVLATITTPISFGPGGPGEGRPDDQITWTDNHPKKRCRVCGIRLMPHEGPLEYGDGPVWECDACLGVTN